jgi:phage major head subunit gpT-like protein
MPNIVISPQVTRRIEDNLEYLIAENWQRRRESQWWTRLMAKRTQATKRDIFQWLLQTARIHALDDGGKKFYDDLVEITHESTVSRFGSSLKLSTDEIEDGEALDRAGQWAKNVGGYAAEWPQIQAVSLLKNGKSTDKLCYDGGAFFATDHPINPYLGSAGGTFANLHYDMPFSAANLAIAYKRVATIKGPDGLYRKLKPRLIAAGEVERLAVVQTLTAEMFSDPVRSGTTAPATNVIKTQYSFSEPILDPDFDETGDAYYNNSTGAYQGATSTSATLATRGVWYVACDLVEDATLGGLVFSEAKAFAMNSFSELDDAELARMDEFEYHFKGRNGTMYGHPFLLHRFEPNPSTGSVS